MPAVVVAATSALSMLVPIGILLAMVLGMYALSRIARKRLGVGAGTLPGSSLKVVGKRTLEPRKSLYVVEVGNRYILVGTGEHQVNLIDHITAEEYEAMAADDEDASRPRLRIARSNPQPTATLDEQLEATGSEPQFATVGESFSHLLSKARSRRTKSHD